MSETKSKPSPKIMSVKPSISHREFTRVYVADQEHIPAEPEQHQKEFRMLFNLYRQKNWKEPAGVAISKAAGRVKLARGVVPVWDEAYFGVTREDV